MLKKLKIIKGFEVYATNQELPIGKVKDIYFDDEKWVARYLVIDTGNWLTGRQVLISPYAFLSVDWEQKRVLSSLTKEQIEKSPGIDSHLPVSRQMEARYNSYYGWPNYWGAGLEGYWGGELFPVLPSRREGLPVYPHGMSEAQHEASSEDMHLRSLNETAGYHIEAAQDEDFGHVEDLVFEEGTWAIRYILVDTRNFWPGGKSVLVSPNWVKEFSWSDRKMITDFTKEAIENCPEFKADADIDRSYEENVHAHFEKPRYWLGETLNESGRLMSKKQDSSLL